MFFMETVESSSAPDSVGTKRKEICKESVGISRKRRKLTDKVHIDEEKETNPTSPFAVANERSTRASLRRSKPHNALHTPINLTGPPNIYGSAQTSNVLQSRRQRVVQPPSSSHDWFKSILDQQDSLSIHDTRIVQGCIGDFKSTLELGDIQNMQFNLIDPAGPFYLPDNERLKLKEGDLSTSKFVSINKNMLLKQLFDLNIFPEHGSFEVLSKTFTVDF